MASASRITHWQQCQRIPRNVRKFCEDNEYNYKQRMNERIITKSGSVITSTSHEVLVTNIDLRVYENKLIPIMAEAGNIIRSRMILHPNNFSRGKCFITYNTMYDAHRACHLLGGVKIGDKHIEVTKVPLNRRLYVGRIPCDINQSEIIRELKIHLDGVISVAVSGNSRTNQNNLGFAFVEFKTRQFALAALKKMLFLWNRLLKINWAYPRFTTHRNSRVSIKFKFLNKNTKIKEPSYA